MSESPGGDSGGGPSSAPTGSPGGGKFGSLIDDFTADVTEAWQQGGAGAMWGELREWLLYPAARHGKLLLVEQALPDSIEVRPPPGVRIERLNDRHWDALAAICKRRMLRRHRRALQRGRVGILAIRDEQVLGYTWLSDEMDRDLEVYPVKLRPKAVYGWNLFVDPAERGKGIGSALVRARMRMARELGYETTMRVIDPENQPAIATVRNSSSERPARALGILYYLKFFRWVPSRFRPIEGEDAVL